MGLREAYVFIHQPEDEYSPRLISAMEEEIDAEAPGLLPPRPEPLSLPPEEPAQLRLL